MCLFVCTGGFAIHTNEPLKRGEAKVTPVWYLRADSLEEKRQWLNRLCRVVSIVRWLAEYEKVKVLGVGGSGIVHELRHKKRGDRFAMKEMKRANKDQMRCAVAEVEILMNITHSISPPHPNILRIEKVFQVTWRVACVALMWCRECNCRDDMHNLIANDLWHFS